MKLRLRQNTVRIRLTQSEVERVGGGEEVRETVSFAGRPLSYVLAPSDDAHAVHAAFDGSEVRVVAPRALVTAWANSNEVGFTSDASEQIAVLVEKDFACLTGRDERHADDDADTYPHPAAAAGSGSHGRCS